MHSAQNIGILSANILVSNGLRELLYEYSSLSKVQLYSSFENLLSGEEKHDILFVDDASYLIHAGKLSAKNIVVLVNQTPQKLDESPTPVLYTLCDEEEMIAQIGKLLSSISKETENNTKKEISDRERDVLVLVAKGYMNKEIADKLNISMNTVITHRKNITSKLGIKTISGLTIYAVINGMISPSEVS